MRAFRLLLLVPVLWGIVSTCFAVEKDSVGLVLSGGGAKGIAHIGVIKALEDNEIPIDYITGTSMGAIVGALYAIGYTPEEMLALFSSQTFYECYSGDLSRFPNYDFRQSAPRPDFLDFAVSVKKFKQAAIGIGGFALVDPAAMNVNFFELFTASSLNASGDFDRLFVPFRCIGSDIYNKKEIVFDSGSLAYALQVSMSIPFFFKPRENEDKKVLIDGGVYDNLPVKPMKDAFHPQFVIASMVAESDKPPMIDDDIGEFFVNMILQRNTYQLSSEEGILINVAPDEIGMMAFEKSQDAYRIGYRKGLQMVDSIRKHVHRRMPESELNAARKSYRQQLPEIAFQQLQIAGVNEDQQRFFNKFFWKDRSIPYTLSGFKHDYLNFFAGNSDVEIVPSAVYDTLNKSYSLVLQTKLTDSPQVALGGNISSMNANQLYVGLRLNRFSASSFNHKAHFYWGNTLSSVALTSDWNTGYRVPMRLQFTAAYNYIRYSESKQVFFEYSKPLFNQREVFGKLKLAFPFYGDGKFESTVGVAYLEDHYSLLDADEAMSVPEKHSSYVQGKAGFAFSKYRMNHKLYPTSGQKYSAKAVYFVGTEKLEAKQGSTYSKIYDGDYNYFILSAYGEKYFPINHTVVLKGLAAGLYSNKPVFANYESTVIQAPGFTPTPHSLIAFNPDLHANKYFAFGFTPILKVNSTTHFRFENYLFMPVEPIVRNNATGQADYGKLFSRNTYFGELSFVLNLPILSVGLFGNYYSHSESKFNFGVNVGYLLFSERWDK